MSAQDPWRDLPNRISLSDVITLELSQAECNTIRDYTAISLSKAIIDRSPLMWNRAKGKNKVNPNEKGMRGEYAVLRYFQENADVDEFLLDRPLRMADMGDVILSHSTIGHKIFDTKTRFRSESLEQILGEQASNYMAEMDVKFCEESHGYLQAFIFCVGRWAEKRIHIMGWMGVKEYKKYATRIPSGSPVPPYNAIYQTDEYLLPYTKLHPMSELETARCFPITHEMTLDMRAKWQKGYDFPLHQFIPAL